MWFHHNVSLTVSLAVRTPPQNVTMVLDTGSELSLLFYARNNVMSFGPRSSATFVAVPCASAQCRSRDGIASGPQRGVDRCSVSLSYADGSSSDAFDSSPVGGPSAGLLGMNRGALSFASRASTPHFSCCISGHDDAVVLLLGLPQRPAHLPPLKYMPVYQPALPLPYFDRVAYSVQLMGIGVGEEGDRGDKVVCLLRINPTSHHLTMFAYAKKFTKSKCNAYLEGVALYSVAPPS
ncbi:aspartic proteinase PCS1-like [Aegilops tauschii subsp. strangulata]|uniref:aspartic proteinase PCS1-like n=1 Tax=Aegilops tauschii subsp. strangulata TaxID=200361 RepID=UPI00098AF26D|nr:aspartic proteinase PCS1-like [Aegilops tauschii subsp. strangulata]